jgi:predicted DCC family thiol-disulfide oxidoreductase YuxK
LKKKAATSRKGASATLLYDGTCGSCSWFARTVHSLDSGGRVRLATLQDEEMRRKLEPRLGERYDQSFHLVDEATGTVRSGEDALLDLARLLPSVKPFAEAMFRIPGVRRIPSIFYRTAAAWRRCSLRAAPPRTDKVT